LSRLISPDGTRIAALNAKSVIQLWPVDGGVPIDVGGIEADETLINWTADGRGILVARRWPLPAVVTRIDLDNGHRTVWKEIMPSNLTGTTGLDQLVIPPHGGGAYFYRHTRNLSELYAVDGLK